jgi:hypothetical protein
LVKRAKDDDEEQVECWIASAGRLWMEGYYDELPLSVQRRLQVSPFNLCPACLVTKFLPKVRKKYPRYSHTKMFLIAIAVMQRQIEERNKKAAPVAEGG